ncbi:hypothetical protein [Nannocystis exedens]|nr:hypothetical protein [Nannocystis exedens]
MFIKVCPAGHALSGSRADPRASAGTSRRSPGAALAAILSFGACSSSPVPSDSPGAPPPVPAPDTPAAECPEFTLAASPGALAPPEIVEASGLAASRQNPGVLWTHNDSDAGGPLVYAFAVDGARYLGRWRLDGAAVHDWEDMALGPGKDGRDALYVGDIGDNQRKRREVVVYRVAEPAVDLAAAPAERRLSGVERLVFTYPGGQAHDAEALLVDPVRGDMCIVTKGRGGSAVFCAAAPLTSGELSAAGELGVLGLVTGGAVSRDGTLVALRTYLAARVWRRDPSRPLAEAFRGPDCDLALALERQGEAIAFAPDGRAYYTVSEGLAPTLHAYGPR